MRPIDSTSIESLGYDEAANKLYVRFRETGDTYVYFLVPRRVHDELTSTVSPGRYLNTCIKAKYPFARLATSP